MFRKDNPELDEAITEIYREMKGVTADSKEYARMVKQLAKLESLKNANSFNPSADTILIIAGNIISVVAILHYEKSNVLVSKALGFLFKLR